MNDKLGSFDRAYNVSLIHPEALLRALEHPA